MERKRNEQQFQLYQFKIGEYINENHWAILLDEIFGYLDFSLIKWKKSPSATSQEPYEARLLTMIWLAGFFRRVYSCRELASRCEDDVGFIYLRRNANSPSKTTLNDFRKENLEEMSNLLAQTVILAKEFGILSGNVDIDGTKVKGNASKKMRLDKKKLEENYEKIKKSCKKYFESIETKDEGVEKEELKEKYKNAEARKKVIEEKLSYLQAIGKERENLTDPDSKVVIDNEDCYDGYNCQIAVDNQIVVYTELSEHENDYYDLEPMVEGTAKVIGYEMKSATTDAGYENSEQIDSLTQKGYDVLVNPVRSNVPEKTKYFNQNDFKYIVEKDVFICPAGKALNYEKDMISKKSNGKLSPKRVYFANKEDCKQCPIKEKCLGGHRTRRDLPVRADYAIIYKNNIKAKTSKGKQRLLRRRFDVEPVFGQIKGHIGLFTFKLRGKLKVSREWRLICLGHNLRKIFAVLRNNVMERLKMRISQMFFKSLCVFLCHFRKIFSISNNFFFFNKRKIVLFAKV